MTCKHCNRSEGLQPDPASYYCDAQDEQGRFYACTLSDCPGLRRKQGLYGKYRVEKLDGDGRLVEDCFVIKFDDPWGWAALLAYAEAARAAGNLKLASDLEHRVAASQAIAWGAMKQ